MDKGGMSNSSRNLWRVPSCVCGSPRGRSPRPARTCCRRSAGRRRRICRSAYAPPYLTLGALLRSNRREGGPALLNQVTAAVRQAVFSASCSAMVRVFRNVFLHACRRTHNGAYRPPQPLAGLGWILDPWMVQVQSSPYVLRKVKFHVHCWALWNRRLKRFLRLLSGFEHEGFGAVFTEMCSAWSCFTGGEQASFSSCEQTIQNLRF